LIGGEKLVFRRRFQGVDEFVKEVYAEIDKMRGK